MIPRILKLCDNTTVHPVKNIYVANPMLYIRGIGLETTILFAREGASVLMADISEPALQSAIKKVLEAVPNARRVETIKCDVSRESDIKAAVDALDAWGGLDVIFNNAGIMHGDDADAVDTPEKIWDLTHNINVKGVWYGSKHAVLSLRKHQKAKGSIINTASVVALMGSATPQLAYTASKGAVLALTRELAVVHAREGFRFNSLCPAPLKYVFYFYGQSYGDVNCSDIAAFYPVPLFFRIGSVTISPSVIDVRCISLPEDSVRLLNKHKLLCS